MRRLIGWLSVLMLYVLMGLPSVHAQTPEWQAWVYNSDNGRMLLIGSDNVIYDDFTLPGLQANDYSWQAVVSPDGQIIVYTLTNTFNQTQTINVYSTVTDTLIATYMIPSQQGQYVANSIDLIASSQAFSPDSRQLAFGYMIEGNWSLIVMDLFNQPGTIRLQLNSTDPIMSSVQGFGFDVPTTLRFDGVNIDFVPIAVGTEGAPTYPHYTYNIPTNTLTRNYYLTVPGGDFSQGDGRYVFQIADYRLPNNNATYQGFGQQINALHLWSPNTTETFPIFNAPNHSIFRPTFIQNREKILMTAYDWNTSIDQYWTIEPSNITPTVMSTLQSVFPNGLEGTGNGFLMAINTNELANVFPELQNFPDRTVLLSFDTRVSANGTSVKQVWYGEQNQTYKLVWVRDNQLASRPAPPAWVPIGDSANASNYDTLTQSSSQPNPTGSLQIGGQARVFTTEGDRANMRSGPGTNFSVIEQLSNDTVVTILEGPQTGDNFTWWRVQTGTNSGWVVESADQVRVLQPFGVLPTVVPTPFTASSASLSIGVSAIVTENGDNLNARRQPSTNASVVAILRSSEIFPVVGGPVTAEGFTWWQVETTGGFAWVAEGTADEKWLLPANG